MSALYHIRIEYTPTTLLLPTVQGPYPNSEAATEAAEGVVLNNQAATHATVVCSSPHPIPGTTWYPITKVTRDQVLARKAAKSAEKHGPAAHGDVRADSAGKEYPYVVYLVARPGHPDRYGITGPREVPPVLVDRKLAKAVCRELNQVDANCTLSAEITQISARDLIRNPKRGLHSSALARRLAVDSNLKDTSRNPGGLFHGCDTQLIAETVALFAIAGLDFSGLRIG